MVRLKKQSSIILSSIVCVVLFYTGIVPVGSKKSLISLFSLNKINTIQGKILSSPTKLSKGNYYSANFNLQFIKDNNDSFSSSEGVIKVFIPSETAEAYYPGKLFTKSIKKGDFICEKGSNVVFNGHFRNNIFIVEKSTSLDFDKTLFGKIDYFRSLCRLKFKRLMYSWGEAGGLLLALLSGAKEYTDNSTSIAFQNAGLSHILALSGMHLSLVSGLALIIGNKLGNKKITLFIKLIFLLLFVWFAGYSPSLMRAFICSFLILLQTASSADNKNMISILSFSFLLQSILFPEDIKNIGFILSYSSLFGILFASNFFKLLFTRFIPYKLSLPLAASSAAQVTSIPISLKLFRSFNPISVIASTIVSPIITIFIYSGLIMIFLCLLFPIFTNPCGFFIQIQYNLIKKIVFIFSKFPRINI